MEDFTINAMPQIRIVTSSTREKNPDEILEENKDKPEFMGCTEWLAKEHSDFPEEKFSSHSLFPLLKEAIQLADFEVDAIENFVRKYMETDMTAEQGETLMGLRQNSMNAKNLVTQLINLLQEKVTIQNILTDYFSDRLIALIEFQAALLGRNKTHITMPKDVKGTRLTNTTDERFTDLEAGFLRSYNTKNKIMRDLLYFLKEQDPTPLVKRLPKELLNSLRVSTSLHPFLNKEDEAWVNYDDALVMGEARNFIGNATDLGIKIDEILKEKNIKGFKKSNVFKRLPDMPLPSFLLTEQKPELQQKEPSKGSQKKKKKNTKIGSKVKQNQPSDVLVGQVSEEIKPFENTKSEPKVEMTDKIELSNQATTTKSSKEEEPIQDSLSGELNVSEDDESITTKESKEEEKESIQAPPLNESIAKFSQTPKKGNKHIDTIYDIFRPKGYTSLNSDRIIAAWKHVLGDNGYHKENTGRSHQPLYATLSQGKKVVMGLFRSSGYGPRYVKYIQEAFDAIGYGKAWLKGQGYKLD